MAGDGEAPRPVHAGDHDHTGPDHGPSPGGRGHRLRRTLVQALHQAVRPHGHDSADAVDSALGSDARGIRAVKLSFVALVVTLSVVVAFYQAVDRLLDPRPLDHLGVLFLGGLAGFVGNQLVARYRIREGEAMGSAALVADGHHAHTDGLTSLAVVLGAAGVWAGFDRAARTRGASRRGTPTARRPVLTSRHRR